MKNKSVKCEKCDLLWVYNDVKSPEITSIHAKKTSLQIRNIALVYKRGPIQCEITILFDATIGYDSSRKASVHRKKKPTPADYKKSSGTSINSNLSLWVFNRIKSR